MMIRLGAMLVLAILAAVSLGANAGDLHIPVLDDLKKGEKAKSDTESQKSGTYTPDADSDRILDLPGLDYDPGFNQFSGYLTVSEKNARRIFYWYVESQNDPKNDPVVFWTNGGPGCSGLLGLGTEHGPFFIDQEGNLSPNEHSWNKDASILYVEQPAGVGFSYSETATDYDTNDQNAASDNYLLILGFLKRFPERQENPFYIASESYGGHYMPQLTMEILNRNTDNYINFKGFLVGNPYVDPFSNTLTQFQAFYDHGLVGKPLYDAWIENCSDRNHYNVVTCEELKDEIFDKWGDRINKYALDYPACKEAHSISKMKWLPSSQILGLMELVGAPVLSDKDIYYPCEVSHLIQYLNRNDVQKALHTKPGIKWTICAKGVIYYHKDGLPRTHLYRELVKMGIEGEHSLNMLVYSGDDDSVCSTAGTQEWIYDLGAEAGENLLWKPWKANEQTAGFVTHFDLGDSADAAFTFVTVHGAGHEVPAYRPIEALQMFRMFLRGEW